MTQSLLRKLSPLAPLALMGFLALPAVAEAASPVRSQGNFGIGLGSGYRHSGLSMKYFAGDTHSLQGVVGTYGYDGSLGFSGSYLYEMPTIVGDSTGLELGWAVGGGPSIGLGDNFLALGAHGVIGLEFNIQPVPIDIGVQARLPRLPRRGGGPVQLRRSHPLLPLGLEGLKELLEAV